MLFERKSLFLKLISNISSYLKQSIYYMMHKNATIYGLAFENVLHYSSMGGEGYFEVTFG